MRFGTAWRISAIFACLLLIFAAGANAQEATFFRYQESAGLKNLTVRCLAQDSRGVLWIGTENGLFRFDGFAIRREPLPVDAGVVILEVKADSRGQVWVATQHAVYVALAAGAGPMQDSPWRRIVKRDGTALRIDGKQRIDWDRNGTLVAMDRDNTLWWVSASSPGRISTLAQSIPSAPFAASTGTFETDAGPVLATDGVLWFGCGKALCELTGGRVRTWGPSDGVPQERWANLLRSRGGGIWARSGTALAHLAPGATRFETVAAPEYSSWPGEIALAEDAQGRMITASDAGIARWDGHAWRQWTPREGLPDTEVRTMFFDSHGALWIGFSGRGLYRWIGYGQSEHWTAASGLPSPVVWSVARDGAGRLLAATMRGVAALDERGKRFREVAPAGMRPDIVTTLARDATGGVWWMQGADLMALRPQDRLAKRMRREPGIASVLPGPGGPYLVERDRVRSLLPDGRLATMPAGLPDPGSLVAVLEDGATRWFLADRHAWRFDGVRWVALKDAAGHPVTIDNGAAFVAPGELWTTDHGGVVVFQVDRGVATPQRSFEPSTFNEAAAVFLRTDRRGGVWLGTDQGVFAFAEGRWHHLDYRNALVWNDVDSDGFLSDDDGTVWIGTSLGLTRLSGAPSGRAPPVLRLDEFRFGDRIGAAPPAAPIPWNERALRLTVGSPVLDLGGSAAVEYRIDDSQPWQRIEGNAVRLDALDSGGYQLQIRAFSGADAEMQGPALNVPFEVAPPWWRTKIAAAGYLSALALAWWAGTLRLRRRGAAKRRALEAAIAQRTAELERSQFALQELGDHNARVLEDERTRVSRELHDELGQQLAAMRMELSVLGIRLAGGSLIGRPDLDVLLERVDELVASVRRLVTGLRPPALDGGLPSALEWLASELRRDASVACTVQCDAASTALRSDIAAMVFRIAQESLTNVRKHAHARHVAIGLSRPSGPWELTVQDDGIGFDPSLPGSGYGLLGMKERARALGATLSVESGSAQGTRVCLRL
jgi:signal transduction histidine kinase